MKPFCPICSDILLRHLCRRKVLWFCPRCHQEMPNFNETINYPVLEKSCPLNISHNQRKEKAINTLVKSDLKSCQNKSDLIDLHVNQDKKRLEVVNFILNQINIILVNTFTNPEKYITNNKNSLERLRTNKLKIDVLTKANFLRDSENILMSICQAILVADSSILNSLNIPDCNNPSYGTKFLIEQSYFMDLMKTVVVDFVSSISSNSSQSTGYFVSEISGYFEIVINLLIELK